MVLGPQQSQHLHVVHASLHLPLDPKTLEPHGHPDVFPKWMNETKNMFALGPFHQECFFTRSPFNPVSPLNPGTPTSPCRRPKHSAIRFWLGSTKFHQMKNIQEHLVPLDPLLHVLQSFLGDQEAQRVQWSQRDQWPLWYPEMDKGRTWEDRLKFRLTQINTKTWTLTLWPGEPGAPSFPAGPCSTTSQSHVSPGLQELQILV